MELSSGGDAPGLVSAARQAGWQFAILAAVGVLGVANSPGRPWLVVAVVGFAVIAVALLIAPSQFWGPRRIVLLTLLLFLSLGISTWCAGDRAIVTGPGFVVAFVWMGLHQRIRFILLSLPPAILTYWLALHLADTPGELAGSALIVIPVAALVGVVISSVVAQSRDARAVIRAEERWRAAIMATLAHDVRAPLTSIIGVLEVLGDSPGIPTGHGALIESANRQAARILRLAAGLLEVERVDQGRLTLDRHDLQLADLLKDIATAQPALALVVDVPADLWVWADRERLEQVLVNLANNAARHGSPPLLITATSDPSGVTISVRDHGTGVTDQDVPQLFERFSSADHSPQSVGLGLWIVRLLTEAHGGSVAYEPADPGANFVVHLPHRPVEQGLAIGVFDSFKAGNTSRVASLPV
jgi:signal transduction histidine kinase